MDAATVPYALTRVGVVMMPHPDQPLEAEGVLTADETGRMVEDVQATMREAHEALRAEIEGGELQHRRESAPARGSTTEIETAVPEAILREIDEGLLGVPEGFAVHPKLAAASSRLCTGT